MAKVPDVKVTTTHSYEIQYKYAWKCIDPRCPFVVKRHSKSVDPKRHCCGRCKGRLVEISPCGASKKKAQPSAYNVFVKEQSKLVRRALVEAQKARGVLNPTVAQSDVMKECAKLWREKKQGC